MEVRLHLLQDSFTKTVVGRRWGWRSVRTILFTTLNESKRKRWEWLESVKWSICNFSSIWRSMCCLTTQVENFYRPFWVGARFSSSSWATRFLWIFFLSPWVRRKTIRENRIEKLLNGKIPPPPWLLDFLPKIESLDWNNCVLQWKSCWGKHLLTSTSTQANEPIISLNFTKFGSSSPSSLRHAFFILHCKVEQRLVFVSEWFKWGKDGVDVDSAIFRHDLLWKWSFLGGAIQVEEMEYLQFFINLEKHVLYERQSWNFL